MIRQLLRQIRLSALARLRPRAPARENAAGLDLGALIRHAARLERRPLPPPLLERSGRLRAAFDAAAAPPGQPCNLFVYHVPLPAGARIDYRDVRMDTSRFDYAAVLRLFVQCAHHHMPGAVIYLATSPQAAAALDSGSGVVIVPLDVDAGFPMYERVQAMHAYVCSRAFNADTVFLDSDAFINAPLADYLDGDFDIAVTFRDTPGLMPVNEGVLAARAGRPERVRDFFGRYWQIYETLRHDPEVQNAYGDIRRWRGGQLSLNALVHDAAPFSSCRQLTLHGVRLRTWPCAVMNYSWEYQAGMAPAALAGRVVLHLKGARKQALDEVARLLQESWCRPAGAYVEPQFAMINKMYREPPFSQPGQMAQFRGHLLAAAGLTQANRPGSGALLCDDLFTWFRNLSFLHDPDFVRAFAPYADDPILRARVWRIYLLCWAARSCLEVDGSFLDLGCYDGRTVDIVCRYLGPALEGRPYCLYDAFEAPPEESRKARHGPGLYAEVCRLFADRPHVRVIPGYLPDSFSAGLPERIAFAQLDLNHAEAEIACLEVIFDRITPGGMLVLDDYGFQRYRASQAAEEAFFAARGHLAFECPTGQGLLIKRACRSGVRH